MSEQTTLKITISTSSYKKIYDHDHHNAETLRKICYLLGGVETQNWLEGEFCFYTSCKFNSLDMLMLCRIVNLLKFEEDTYFELEFKNPEICDAWIPIEESGEQYVYGWDLD